MSILKTIPIALDLKRVGAQAQALPTLVEGDNGNVFVITLTDDGEPLSLENASRVICVFSKTSDGRTVEQDTDDGSVTVGGADHNVITIELKAGSYGAGTNNCEVQIYSGDNSDILVTTANFNFRGRKGIMNDETIQSEDKYPIIVSLIQQVMAALAAALPYTNVTASAALLPPGSTATASVTVGEDSAAFAFGIPEGVHGNGISSFTLASGDHSAGSTDVYRMDMTDGTSYNVPVYNGVDGALGLRVVEETLVPNASVSAIYYDTKANWDAQISLVSERAAVYVYSDYATTYDDDNNLIYVAGIKIGDGSSYLIDMPFITEGLLQHLDDTTSHITDAERTAWNNKVTVYLDSENAEDLVFSKS